jgi:hypothetical protein
MIIPFPSPKESSPLNNAYGHEPLEEAPRIDITAGHRKVWAVRINGRIWSEFDTDTAAARVASALHTLEAYELLERVR